ncbi:16S rRNA (guanine(966)-N(2))-methyltransferase RsmD [Aureibaculum sp. 2210JD6-5]|uniref:16S rRNA (guanine(966)-N(2))-methyltransferase RsmD n=1 Tax=Aureibaculum sp. 2210JD6-5 TaxID=3103957 RepID=UPI002AADBCF5|nr:16S rRNA (guanine(966)-N(2))-methyltransferase RsmD [Aureibaculum sp. 2210JD6-5]MDY7394232.1 16S rRNA (guanine(966)-N(2))-methyltransferase RsmD [Aureibaculum sp. 2210JD6-5]
MRIISGKYKGKRVTAPKKLPARPTTDFAKESLFNIINNNYYFEDLSVLDLFAGIGSISLEFASRGAKDVISVDNHYNSVQFIQKISDELQLNIKAIKSDAFAYLNKNKLTFDIIFADPPYNFTKEQLEKIIFLVSDKKLLNQDGLLIIEHSKHTDISDLSNFSYSKKYGSSMFSFFDI